MKRLLLTTLLIASIAGARAQAVLSVIDSTGGTTLDTVNANQAVAYDILVQNIGNQPFAGDISVVVAVQDSLGSPITFHVDTVAFASASIPAGGFVQGTVTHSISMSFYNNGNNITVIWPQTPNTNTVDTLYIPTYVLQPSGIGQADDLKISLYPNPTNGPVRIELAGERIQTLEVYSMTGAIVARGSADGRLDLSALPQGQYVLVLQTRSGKVATRSLLKQ